MFAWPGYKFLITCKTTQAAQSQHAFNKLLDFLLIVKHDHTEIWQEVEKTIAAAEKPFKIQYALFFEHSPMFGGEKIIPTSFKHGDFARSIIHTCKHGASWMKTLTSKHHQQVMEVYKAFIENHEIIVTHE